MSELFHYSESTPQAVSVELEKAYYARKHGRAYRIRVFYGDTQTGRDWCEEYGVTGYVGRSGGSKPIALLVHNSRSLGGTGISTNCIVRITVNGKDRYRHPNYHQPIWYLGISNSANLAAGYRYTVYADGQTHACFKTEAQAARWIDFITGRRNNK